MACNEIAKISWGMLYVFKNEFCNSSFEWLKYTFCIDLNWISVKGKNYINNRLA